MSIPVQNPIASYTGNGSATQFAYSWYLIYASDLEVRINGVLAPSNIYTVTGLGNVTGGNVVFNTPPTAGSRIIMQRNVPLSRDTNYVDNGDFLANTVNADFDRIWMAMQDVNTISAYSLRVADIPLSAIPQTASERAGKILSADLDGNPVFLAPQSGSAVDVLTQLSSKDGLKLIGQVNNVTELRTINGLAGQKILLKEYTTGLGVGGGELFGVASASRVDDGVTFFRVSTTFGWARDVSRGISLQDAGAVGDGVISGTSVSGTNDSVAVLRAFNARIPIKEKAAHTYRLSSGVSVVNGYLNFEGAGRGNTVFAYDHLNAGMTFGAETYSANKYYGSFSKCGVVRPGYAAYSGAAGPKSLSFGNFSPLTVSDVEETQAVGYGIFAVFCDDVSISLCHAHDHKGTFAGPLSGTDGIHLYKCTNGWVNNCTVDNVGDDGISSGSFDSAFPCVNINFTNNRLNNVFGTLKLYGFVNGADISGNEFRTGHEGGVYLTNDANALNGAYVKNIKIHHNNFFSINGGASNVVAGGVLLRMWPDNGTANATASIDHIYISDNIIDGCGSGVAVVTQDSFKRYSNLFIRHNTFRNASLSQGGDRPYVRIHQCDYEMDISDNYFNDAHSAAISIDHVYGSYSATMQSPHWNISKNRVFNYNLNPALTTMSKGILVRYSSMDLVLEMTGNQVYGQRASDTVSATQGILVNNISPNSFIEANQSDSAISISGSNGAYKGMNKGIVGAPSSGTHYLGSSLVSVSTGILYTCSAQGTFGTLSGVTANTTSGSKTVTVNDVSNIYAGAVITIAGVTGAKKILKIIDTTLTIDSACDASVSGAAVGFSAPVFKTLTMAA